MAKCGACGKFVSASEGAKCSKCTLLFDRLCVALPGTGRINQAWVCPSCSSKVPRDNNSETPVKGIVSQPSVPPAVSPSSADALDLALQMKLLREELVNFRSEMARLQSGVSACENRITDLESRMMAIEQRKDVPGDTGIVQTSELMATVSRLQDELNDRNQELLQNDIELRNIPEETGENSVHLVTVVATKLGLNLDEKDIVCAVRMGSQRTVGVGRGSAVGSTASPQPRTLVVRLTRRTLRDEFLRSARVRRTATTADMGFQHEPVKFYVNERLTRINRQLFNKAREAGRESKWKFIWTKDGKIYVRQHEGKPVHRIRSDVDVANIFGTPSVGTDSK